MEPEDRDKNIVWQTVCVLVYLTAYKIHSNFSALYACNLY